MLLPPIRLSAHTINGENPATRAVKKHIFPVIYGLLGLLLPIIVLNGNKTLSLEAAWWERITIADWVCLVLLILLFFLDKVEIPASALLYIAAIAYGFIFAAVGIIGPELPLLRIAVASMALGMAILYFVVGYNAIRHKDRVIWFFAGLALAITFEASLVIHDFFIDPDLFPDFSTGIGRGTFSRIGQTGAFFYAGGTLLLAYGWSVFSKRIARAGILIAGFLGLYSAFLTGRRAVWIAILVSIIVYLLLSVRHWRSREFLAGVLVLVLLGGVCWFSVNDYIVYRTTKRSSVRFVEAVEKQLSPPEAKEMKEELSWNKRLTYYLLDHCPAYLRRSFPVLQFIQALYQGQHWIPFGAGPGADLTILETRGKPVESHNLYLALAIQFGIFGVAAGLALFFSAWPFFKTALFRERFVRILIIALLIGAVVRGVHGRLDRNRTFLFGLGILSAHALSERRKSGHSSKHLKKQEEQPVASGKGNSASEAPSA